MGFHLELTSGVENILKKMLEIHIEIAMQQFMPVMLLVNLNAVQASFLSLIFVLLCLEDMVSSSHFLF